MKGEGTMNGFYPEGKLYSFSENKRSMSSLAALAEAQMKETVSDAWNKTVTYGINAYCIHKNALWKCLLQHTNQEPVNGSIYWEKCTVATELSKLNSDLVNMDNNKINGIRINAITTTNTTEYVLAKEIRIPKHGTYKISIASVWWTGRPTGLKLVRNGNVIGVDETAISYTDIKLHLSIDIISVCDENDILEIYISNAEEHNVSFLTGLILY